MTPRIEILTGDDWAAQVAAAWAERIAASPNLRMCLPTGATPKSVYDRIAGSADFSQSAIFILDEFGLPPGDPARCDQMLRRDLLDRLDRPPASIDGLDPQAADLDEECARYSSSVVERGLDLTLLGLGANGHLGLNEPGSTATSTTRVVDLAEATRAGLSKYGAEHDTYWGMTLGLSELLASREIWLLVRGRHKAEILEGALKDRIGPSLPATFLREASNVTVWADQEAASLL